MSTIWEIAAEEYSFAVADLTKTLFIPKILGLTHILHHSQEQARCLFHKKIHSLWNRHLACS
ncbi:hypothetical protein QT989_22080 [Microcoleus sp. SVA1_B6]